MKKIWIIVLVVVALIAIYMWSSYNGLVTKNEAIDGQWAQVEAQYQRRFDLIPNLVNAVKGALTQEKTIFNDIAQARTHYAGATTVNDKVAATNEVESSLARLMVIVENYPQLASLQNVRDLQAQLEGTENRISVERMRFNDTVQAYNVSLKHFPTNLIAGMFGFSERNYFKADTAAATAPTVNLQ